MKTIFFPEHFKKQIKSLKKKYPQVKDDLLERIDAFDPDKEIAIGRSIYKIRIPSRDMQKGKSGGFRSYIYVYFKKEILVPLCIYPKSETENISENELKHHFDKAIQELLSLQNL